jgi:hypothetical protein
MSLFSPINGMALLAGVVSCLALAGCSKGTPAYENRSQVTGSVTFQGKPVRAGSVVMVAKDNPGMMGASVIREDGSFAFADAPLGPVALSVTTESVKFGGNQNNYVEIPAKYGDPATSGLTAEIKATDNPPIDLKLE